MDAWARAVPALACSGLAWVVRCCGSYRAPKLRTNPAHKLRQTDDNRRAVVVLTVQSVRLEVDGDVVDFHAPIFGNSLRAGQIVLFYRFGVLFRNNQLARRRELAQNSSHAADKADQPRIDAATWVLSKLAPGGSRKQTASATTRRERVDKQIYANALGWVTECNAPR